MYAIQEQELDSVSMLNGLATLFFSVGSAFLFLAVGILIDWAIESTVTDIGKVLVLVVAPMCGAIGIIAFVVAVILQLKRHNQLKRILQESQSD